MGLEFLSEGLKLLAANRLAPENLLVVFLADRAYNFRNLTVYGGSKDMLEVVWHVLVVPIFPLVRKYYICLELKRLLT